jgi:hypothetical protein
VAFGRRIRRIGLVTASLVSFVVFAPTNASAAPLFTDGFESGNMTNWTISQAVQVQSAITFAGSFAARIASTGGAAFAQKQLASSASDLYMDARVHVVSLSGTTTLLRYKTASDTKVLSLSVKSNGALQVKNHITGAVITSATVMTTGAWHELQVHGLISGASGRVDVWLDGAVVADLGGTQDLGTAAIGRVEIASNQSSSGFDAVFDDVIVDTAFIGGVQSPPATPTNLHTTSVTANQVSLAWNASTGADTYRVYRDGGQIGVPSAPFFQDTGVQPSTQYAYTVDACNEAGCSDQTGALLVTTPAAGGDTVVMAAGDIACDPADPDFHAGNGDATHCREKYTAQLLSGADAVLAVGDTQYECGGSTAYAQSYDPTWGQFKSITFPAIGDQEYGTSGTGCGAAGPDGYFGYFGSAAHPESNGYYSFDLGSWHVIMLNPICNEVGGCVEGSPQNNWLESDLAAHPNACTLVALHIPQFASKKNGSQVNTKMRPFWDDLVAAHADVILAGNSHFYERFEKQNATGQPNSNGMVEFIVGTGGKSHGGLALPANRLPTSEVGDNHTFGVLSLTLHSTGYDWEFLAEGSSTFTDVGTAACV